MDAGLLLFRYLDDSGTWSQIYKSCFTSLKFSQNLAPIKKIMKLHLANFNQVHLQHQTYKILTYIS